MDLWKRADEQLPEMHTEIYEDFDESVEYEESDPVLAFTNDRKVVVAKCCYDRCGNPWWYDDDGTDYNVTHWQKLPTVPEEEHNG